MLFSAKNLSLCRCKAWMLGVLLTLGLNLSHGCQSSRAGEKGEVVLRSSFWGMTQEAKIWEELAEKFHRTHPNIRIKLEHITGQNYHSKVLAMTVGNCPPDVLAADDEPFRQLATSGLYADLTPFLKNDPQVDVDAFYKPFQDSFRIEGRPYALPYIGHCLLIYYNRAHRRAAGLSPDPNPNWTWDEFTSDARKLTRDLDGDGRIDQFGLNRLSWFYCLQWIWSAGGSDMDTKMTRYTFDTPEAKQGFQFHYDHMHKYHICPMMSDLPNMSWESMFFTGKVSMMMTGSWWLVQVRSAKNLDWDVAPMPIGPKCRATRATTEGIAISPQSKYPKEAWEWVKFVVSDEGQAVFAKSGRGIPSVKRVARATFPNPQTPQHEEYFLDALDNYSHITSIHPHWMETEQVFNREWDRVYLGQISIDQFVQRTLPEANAIVRGESL